MKLPEYIQQILDKWRDKGSGRNMTTKEKWILMLLSGLLLAVIIFPMGKQEENELSGLGTKTKEQIQGNYLGSIATGYDFGNSIGDKETGEIKSGNTTELHQYELYLSGRLKEILAQIEGAGKVEAWVTLSGSSERILYEEKDMDSNQLEEADSVGGVRTEKSSQTDKTVVTDSTGNPYIVKTLQPEVEGVLVVAEGADDSIVKKNISEAVQVLFGIDAHRIKVAKKKAEE